MNQFDVVVIGGGIHGAGVLQAAAASGHRCLLIERKALASGTSSRSSKLIHGGLRYLESGQFRLVWESLHERAVMLRTARELVQMRPFYIPVYRNTRRRPWQLRLGLFAYAALGGFATGSGFGSVPKSQWHTLDGLETRDLDAVIRYHDAQTDDAELTRSVVASARELGAELAMPASFARAQLEADGVLINYEHDGAMRECRAHAVVNAAGPWATHVARDVRPAIEIPRVDLVQGTHIVVPVPTTAGIYYVESPSDGRAVFIMPWKGATLIGTTETAYHGEPDQVRPLPEEETYLLEVAQAYFAGLRGLTRDDISERFAGLRVLPAGDGKAFGRSRETMLIGDRDERPRFLSIYGGKLTAWRATAEQVMERIETSLPRRRSRASTEDLPLRRSE
jgi:glycerol-3-phosphate dehydrogenase